MILNPRINYANLESMGLFYFLDQSKAKIEEESIYLFIIEFLLRSK